MTKDEVFDEIVRRAWRLGAAVLLLPESSIDIDGSACNGFLDTEPAIPTIVVTTKHEDSHVLGVLLHEYSHLTQFVEKCTAWQNATKYDHKNQFEWVKGKHMTGMKDVLAAVREMEADNERRTVRLIRELDAPLDVAQYSRKANSYLHFHNVMLAERKWYSYPGALYIPEILVHCNSTIDANFDKTPKKLYDAILKHAI